MCTRFGAAAGAAAATIASTPPLGSKFFNTFCAFDLDTRRLESV